MHDALDAFDIARLAKEKMPYVTFKTEAEEDLKASREKGRYIGMDVDYACITTPGTKDVLFERIPDWWEKKFDEVRNGRCPQAWLDKWQADYDRFKKGQELPTEGTPIRGWSQISPAQMEAIIRANILTVEDMATANDTALQMIGMGAVNVKYKAEAWLKQAKSKGPVTQELAAVKRERDSLQSQVATLEAQVTKLKAMVKE